MEEAFIAACVLRTLIYREEGVELHSDEDGVLHLALSCTRVYVASLDTDCGSGCIEILIFKLADLASVEGVGILGSEFRNVELHDSAADLLVRCESDLDLSVLEFRMLHDVLYCVHDLSDTGLVVRSEEGSSVCGDKRLALVKLELRELRWLEAEARHALERDLAAVIVFDDLRLDVVS